MLNFAQQAFCTDTIPQTAPVKYSKTLTAIASVEYANKQNHIPLTLIQTHGVLIADQKAQSKPKDLTVEEFRRLHAAP
jgi:hypothetical protein